MKSRSIVMRLFQYIKPHWHLILASTIAGVIKLTVPLLAPQVLRYFTDYVLVEGSVFTAQQKGQEILKWTLFLICVYIFVYIPCAYIRQIGSTEVSNRIMHTLRCEVYGHLQKMSASFHQHNKSGNLVTRINSDVEQVHDFVWNVATNIWIDSIVLVVYLGLMGSINLPLTLLTAVVLPLSVLITKKIRMHIKSERKKVQRNISEISGYMQERMAGFATVKLFHMEEHEKKKFFSYSNDIYRFTRKANRYFSLGEAVTASMSEIISAIIVGLSAFCIIHGKMSIGEMIVFYSYLGYFVTPLRRFSELNVTYAKSVAGIERVFEILDTPTDIQEAENAIDLTADTPMHIRFEHVFFHYDKADDLMNLSDIDFSIKAGEQVALVGSSGCGKTTLINLLARFYDVDSGAITIDGENICNYRLQSLYDNIGMVFQDTVLFSETIEENIRYGRPDATMEEVERAAKAANAYNFIMDAPQQWQTKLGERGIGLSGGQKQRIAIARVFLKNPSLLILDEATSALDSESEKLVQEALENLMEKRTSIVIAHRLSTIINADRIVVMHQGRILETGTHAELLAKNGRYTQLYHMQFEGVITQT
ncbi:MAG: ABC transporter ATP-binding protein [Lachnospiraceae bacterium]|nr:ABC transporter ATP-binding protein [Lachnospiraceae bacterium]